MLDEPISLQVRSGRTLQTPLRVRRQTKGHTDALNAPPRHEMGDCANAKIRNGRLTLSELAGGLILGVVRRFVQGFDGAPLAVAGLVGIGPDHVHKPFPRPVVGRFP